MYRVSIDLVCLDESNEASQDRVDGIMMDEWRVWLGTGCFNMSRTSTGVSKRCLICEADALGLQYMYASCKAGIDCND